MIKGATSPAELDGRRLCELARITDMLKQRHVADHIDGMLGFLWENYRADRAKPPFRAKDLKAAKRDLTASHTLLRAAAKSLLSSLLRLAETPMFHVSAVVQTEVELLEEFEKRQKFHAEISLLETIAEDDDWGTHLLRASHAPESRGRGRPTGSSPLDDCRFFIIELLVLVEGAGGRLTFNKAYPDKGTLMPVLRLLSEHLPPGVIPKKLSPSWLAEVCTDVRRARGGIIRRPRASNDGIIPPIAGR